ncbi:MAG TPA: FAD-dependent oxidoreductase [Trichocoleus sp.]
MSRPHRSAIARALASSLTLLSLPFSGLNANAQEAGQRQLRLPSSFDATVECEILIVGGGLAGTAAAYESLLAGRTVCMTELTDWVGGQISSQGTTALDESKQQRNLLFYSRGYKELRNRVERHYGELNPGKCWVSASCFMPYDADKILRNMLQEAERKGGGKLNLFNSTVVKDLTLSRDGSLIETVIGIQHSPAPGTPPLNTEPLSQMIEDAYRYEDSARFTKKIIQFVPKRAQGETAGASKTPWYVVEATETGELVAIADVPYELGLDPRSPLNPSSPVTTRDPYCTQGFTYTFAMEHTKEPQPQQMPSFYPIYEPYYSYEKTRQNFKPEDYFDFVFTYRRLWNAHPRAEQKNVFGVPRAGAGDISMQNWTWGNDYRPGTEQDNLILTHEQLEASNQLESGGWMGGLRTETLRKGEENAIGFYYWLVAGTTDSQLGDGYKVPDPNNRYLSGFDSPMRTAHGLSKYPYIREGRRIIGRPSYGYEQGFMISEVDFSWNDFATEVYREALGPEGYLSMRRYLAGLATTQVLEQDVPATEIPRRTRSRIYPDAVGIAQYAIDFHPCMAEYPAEKPGNIERPGVRDAHGQAYPAQIPLRAMIPQRIDNMLVASKSIAASYSAAAAYRVHSFEWSVGAAAGQTVDFVLEQNVFPYELVDNLPEQEPLLEVLRHQITNSGNPVMFPNTSIFNEDWDIWRPW